MRYRFAIHLLLATALTIATTVLGFVAVLLSVHGPDFFLWFTYALIPADHLVDMLTGKGLAESPVSLALFLVLQFLYCFVIVIILSKLYNIARKGC